MNFRRIIHYFSFVIVLVFSPLVQAGQPGSYDHKRGRAHIAVPKNMNYESAKEWELLAVNFDSETVTRLAEGSAILNVAINHDGSMLTYSDYNGFDLRVRVGVVDSSARCDTRLCKLPLA